MIPPTISSQPTLIHIIFLRYENADWKTVESEIQRMTNEFKSHLEKHEQKQEKRREKREERSKRKGKKLKKNLNYLYEKYGLDPSSSEEEDTPVKSNSWNPTSEQAVPAKYIMPAQSIVKPEKVIPEKYLKNPNPGPYNKNSVEAAKPSDPVSQPDDSDMFSVGTAQTASHKTEETPNNQTEVVCWTCRRKFMSQKMLDIHCEKSDLHKQNLEKEANPWNKFKSSFVSKD